MVPHATLVDVLRTRGWIPLVWLVIGVVVAVTHHFFDHIGTIGAIVSAILAVLLWPLVLLGVHFAIGI